MKERTRSRYGEDKIRGLGGWLSYIDKLYRIRKDKPFDRVDKATPMEHYLRSAVAAFISGVLLYGFVVLSIGIPVYMVRFKRIEVTRKLFRVIIIAVIIGSFLTAFIIYNYVTSERILKTIASKCGAGNTFFSKRIGDPLMKGALEVFCFLGRQKTVVQGTYVGLFLIMSISCLVVRKVKK